VANQYKTKVIEEPGGADRAERILIPQNRAREVYKGVMASSFILGFLKVFIRE
jgi:hypothetical protein